MTDYTAEAFDADARRYLELDDVVQSALSEINAIKARFRGLGEGPHKAPCGVQVAVTAPNRAFNLVKAVDFLNDEQRDLARSNGYDSKKVKYFLPPALLDLCMEAGTGDLRVVVK